jgi:hypothetical protein
MKTEQYEQVNRSLTRTIEDLTNLRSLFYYAKSKGINFDVTALEIQLQAQADQYYRQLSELENDLQ